MGLAKTKPRFNPPADIEDDLYAWCFEQAELLRQKRFAEADLPNIIEELESMGRSERRALRSAYRLVVSHLLKWRYQPSHRTMSWRTTIARERTRIADIERDSHSLRADARTILEEAYPAAVNEAAVETMLPPTTFPAICPFPFEDVRRPDFWPD